MSDRICRQIIHGVGPRRSLFVERHRIRHKQQKSTRMHSSRMRAGRSLTVCWGVCLTGAVPSSGGGVPPSGKGGWYPSMHWGRPPCGQNDRQVQKYYLAATSLRPVKKVLVIKHAPRQHKCKYLSELKCFPYRNLDKVIGLPTILSEMINAINTDIGHPPTVFVWEQSSGLINYWSII